MLRRDPDSSSLPPPPLLLATAIARNPRRKDCQGAASSATPSPIATPALSAAPPPPPPQVELWLPCGADGDYSLLAARPARSGRAAVVGRDVAARIGMRVQLLDGRVDPDRYCYLRALHVPPSSCQCTARPPVSCSCWAVTLQSGVFRVRPAPRDRSGKGTRDGQRCPCGWDQPLPRRRGTRRGWSESLPRHAGGRAAGAQWPPSNGIRAPLW